MSWVPDSLYIVASSQQALHKSTNTVSVSNAPPHRFTFLNGAPRTETHSDRMYIILVLPSQVLATYDHLGDAILCAPGMPHEVERCLVDGQMLKVYKNLWPSLRTFWIEAATQFGDRTYVVYENQRFSYDAILQKSLIAAAVFKGVYNIHKGDRVTICSRNLPEYLIAFWACHLLGAVSVLVNAYVSFPLLPRHPTPTSSL